MVTPTAIIDAVSSYYGIKARDLRGTNRCRDVAAARAVGMYLMRKMTGMSFPRIGAFFGGKDHSTVIAASNKVQRWIGDGEDRDCRVAEAVMEIEGEVVAEQPDLQRLRLESIKEGLQRQVQEIDRALARLPVGRALETGRAA